VWLQRNFESLIVDWFGKLRVNLGPVLMDSYSWLGGDLFLRTRKLESKVGWNVQHLHPIGELII
jgi:hypothetical protein